MRLLTTPGERVRAVVNAGRSPQLIGGMLCLLASVASAILVAGCTAIPIGVLGIVLLIRFIALDPMDETIVRPRRLWPRSHDGVAAAVLLQIAAVSFLLCLSYLSFEEDAASPYQRFSKTASDVALIAGFLGLAFLARFALHGRMGDPKAWH